jgi:hypothetical protein
MKPIDRTYIDEHDIAQRYLHGGLTPEESEEFEVYILENPEILEELELSEAMKKFMPKPDSETQGFKYLQSKLWSILFPATVLAVAFSALAFMLIPSLQFEAPRSYGQTEIVYLSSMRSGDTSTYTVDGTTEQLVLVLNAQQDGSTLFDVEATFADRTVFSGAIQQDASGDLIVALPLSEIKGGLLEVQYKNQENPTNSGKSSLLIEE